MRHKIQDLILTVAFLFFFAACGGGGGDDATPSTAPRISSVRLYKVVGSSQSESYSFTIGDTVNIRVAATDPDLDMETIYISQYLMPDLDSPYFPTSDDILPSQAAPNMEYYFIEPIDIEGPAGNWRACFLIVDKAGNESNEFCVNAVVN